MPNSHAQAEQVRATRRLCPAVAACLHCKAANRLPAIPSRSWTSRDSAVSPSSGGDCRPTAAMCSNSASSVDSSATQCSAGAASVSGASLGLLCPALAYRSWMTIPCEAKALAAANKPRSRPDLRQKMAPPPRR